MTGLVESVSASEFKDAIKKGNVLVDFWASWCGPCKVLGKTLDGLTDKLSAMGVKVVKVDIEQAADLAIELGVSNVPTLMFFQDGQKVTAKNGNVSSQQVVSFVQGCL